MINVYKSKNIEYLINYINTKMFNKINNEYMILYSCIIKTKFVLNRNIYRLIK